jgi:hypothetical protein
MTSIQWAPLVLTPLVLMAWLILFVLLFDPRLRRRLLFRVPGARRLWRAWWTVRRFLGRARHRRQTLEHSRMFDADQNAETTPPEDVSIRWGGMWTVEIYTPTHMPRLIEGLRALGWDTNRRFRGSDLVSWLSNMRTGTGGWTSAGPFRPRGAPAWHLQELDIPRGFSLMVPVFFQLAPGLVALMVGWVFEPEEQGAIEATVREPAESTAESLKGGGTSVTSADMNKAARVAKLRNEMRDRATSWVGDSLPGLFMRDLTTEPMPAWDLLLTDGTHLVREQLGGHDWRDVVGYAVADEWKSPDTLGLSMLVPRFLSDRNAAVPALFATRADIVDDGHNGDSSTLEDYPWWLIQRLNESLGPLLGWWAVEGALDGIDRALAEAREDLVGAGGRTGRVRPRLDAMRKRVLPATFHVSALARGAQLLQDPESYVRRTLPHFEGVERQFGPTSFRPRPLEEAIVERLAEASTRLVDDARSTAEGWRAFTDVLLARTNLNLQNTIIIVTAVATLASVAAVVISLSD